MLHYAIFGANICFAPPHFRGTGEILALGNLLSDYATAEDDTRCIMQLVGQLLILVVKMPHHFIR